MFNLGLTKAKVVIRAIEFVAVMIKPKKTGTKNCAKTLRALTIVIEYLVIFV